MVFKMEQFSVFIGNNALLSAAWFAIVILIIFTTIKIKLSPVKQISPQDLTFLVNRSDGIVLDIRNDNEFKRSHIIDAKHISSDKITKKDFSSLENDKDKPIIVVCAAGLSASKVANDLYKAGFTQASLLKGGMNAWIGANLPIVKK